MKQVSNKQRAKNARELYWKIEIIKRAQNRCEYVNENGVRCERMGTCLYPLSVHHLHPKSLGGELKEAKDGKAYCIIHHMGAEGIKAKFSEPKWSKE